MYHDLICSEFKSASIILDNFLQDKNKINFIEDAAKLIVSAFNQGGKIVSCGNGGSHCDAMHFAEELTGKYREKRIGYPAIAISDPSYFSCVSNEFGYKFVFSRYIESICNNKDILMVISTSGNSINIMHAIQTAHKKEMRVIALTGNTGGMIAGKVDIEINVPYFGYADRIQEIHIKIIHILIFIIEKYMDLKNK